MICDFIKTVCIYWLMWVITRDAVNIKYDVRSWYGDFKGPV